jgi:predicted metal-binding protein
MQKELIEQLLSDPSLPCTVHELAWVSPRDIPFSEGVRGMCAANRCGVYGKSWACPPGVGDWETLRDECYSYARILVYTTKHVLEDDFDIEGMQQAAQNHKQFDRTLSDLLEAHGIAYHLYGAGTCALCPSCTYPDAPCRFPTRAHHSMEACGIDVGALARLCGIKYNNGALTVTYFSMLAFD